MNYDVMIYALKVVRNHEFSGQIRMLSRSIVSKSPEGSNEAKEELRYDREEGKPKRLESSHQQTLYNREIL